VTVAGVGRSPVMMLFGVWADGRLITAHEAVTKQRKRIDGVMQTTAVAFHDMDDLGGVDCRDTDGPLLGTVGQFENPGRVFGRPVSPLVFIDARESLNTSGDPHWSPEDALPVERIQRDLPVRIEGTEVTGKVVEVVRERQYLDTKSVIAAVVHFAQNQENRDGSPIVLENGNGQQRLVGMLFRVESGGGETVAFCFPAARIASIAET
jgi:hypothetical protein